MRRAVKAELLSKDSILLKKSSHYDKNFMKFVKVLGELEPIEMLGVAHMLKVDLSDISVKEGEEKSEDKEELFTDIQGIKIIEDCCAAFNNLIRSAQNRLIRIMKDAAATKGAFGIEETEVTKESTTSEE